METPLTHRDIKDTNLPGGLNFNLRTKPQAPCRVEPLGPGKFVLPPVQLGLFWETLHHARLVAINHPRPVYYEIWLETMAGCGYRVRKSSGIQCRTPDKRAWRFDSLVDATRYFTAKIRQKTNLERKSPRKYRVETTYAKHKDVMPKRIQRKRKKGWRMPSNAVYVGRPSRWGNPYTIDACGSPEKAVEEFERFVELSKDFQDMIISELKGKDLACWCPLNAPCHADVLLKIANIG